MALFALVFHLLSAAEPATAVSPTHAPQQSATPSAPESAPDDEEAFDLGELEIVAARPRGSVDSDIPPDVVLDAEQMKAYGAGNISELVEALAPLTQSSRGGGSPIMLVNGRRISGFQEIARIPVDAIERTEVLPEDVALAYGYAADRRVMNFVLKTQFASTTVETELRRPTLGGRTTQGVELSRFMIAGRDRRSLDLELERDTALFETERDIVRRADGAPFSLGGVVGGLGADGEIDPVLSALVGRSVRFARVPATMGVPSLADFAAGADPAESGDLTAYRTLLPARDKVTVEGSIVRDLNASTSGTLSFSLDDQSRLAYQGLPTATLTVPGASPFSPFGGDVRLFRYFDGADPLTRQTDTLTAKAAGLLDGYVGEWRWTLSGDYERVETDTRTARGYDLSGLRSAVTAGDPSVNPFGAVASSWLPRLPDDTARSVSSTTGAELVLAGSLYELPAGGLRTTLKVGLDSRSLESVSVRSGEASERSQSRERATVQGNLRAPIARRGSGVLSQVGDVSASANFAYEELSDFGGLVTLGGAVDWSPIEKLSFNLGYSIEDVAPTMQQLNDPVIFTANTLVYDYATGQTVSITRIEGGNDALKAESKDILRFGATLKPFNTQDLSLSSTYTRTSITDQVGSFPDVTADLERAFPERFVRDGAGVLVSVDARPVTFQSANRQEVRSVLTFSRAFGTPTAAPGGPRGPGAGMGPGAGRGPGGGGQTVMITSGGGAGMGQGGFGAGPRRSQGMQPGQGRFNVNLTHVWRLEDEVVVRDGLAPLDLLDGASISGRGGQPRHELQLQAGVFRNGMGAFLWGQWKDETWSQGGALGQDLFFSDLATLSLNAFVDFNARQGWVERYPWLKGARLNVGLQNLFDARVSVRDATGETPLNYQPHRMDPIGRAFRVSLRKQF